MKSQIVDSVVRRGGSVLAAVAFAFVASTSASAASIPSLTTATSFQFGYNQGGNASGWSNASSNPSGYNFDFSNAASATSTGAPDNQPPGNSVILDSATTADAACTSCSILGLDSVYHVGAVTTTLSGLTSGVSYTLTFDFAGTQQKGFSGTSTDFLTVSFGGGPGQNTGTVNVGSQGFSGWQGESFSFIANGATEAVSFLATGTPAGNGQDPAFALVDNLGISQTAPTPEPSSLMLLGTGLAGLGGLVRSRLSKRS